MGPGKANSLLMTCLVGPSDLPLSLTAGTGQWSGACGHTLCAQWGVGVYQSPRVTLEITWFEWCSDLIRSDFWSSKSVWLTFSRAVFLFKTSFLIFKCVIGWFGGGGAHDNNGRSCCRVPSTWRACCVPLVLTVTLEVGMSSLFWSENLGFEVNPLTLNHMQLVNREARFHFESESFYISPHLTQPMCISLFLLSLCKN